MLHQEGPMGVGRICGRVTGQPSWDSSLTSLSLHLFDISHEYFKMPLEKKTLARDEWDRQGRVQTCPNSMNALTAQDADSGLPWNKNKNLLPEPRFIMWREFLNFKVTQTNNGDNTARKILESPRRAKFSNMYPAFSITIITYIKGTNFISTVFKTHW